ncbi:uncharacterized protein [Mytilus edulis]|uniref:uncharacterized protein isoform X1 n=1 Tax=Mytilus edulis TaxID=6550 RepID=UPI0039EFD082
MASVYHEIINDSITVDDEEIDELSAQGYDEDDRLPTLHIWPKNIGIIQIVFGFVTVCIGVLEIFYLPLVIHPEEEREIHLGKDNCYGAGLFAGICMVLTGSTAVRASISRRPTSVRKFFNLTIFTLLLYVASAVLLIVGYSVKWTTRDQYPVDSYLYEIHIFVSVFTMIGFLFIIATFVQYYETIFCGDFQLCYNWFSCCLRCIPKKPEIRQPIALNQPI